MKLYHSPTSPYARNVLAVAGHHDLLGQIEIISTNPFDDRTLLQARNPLGKVPALELADGSVLFDSSVIVEYLNRTGRGDNLFSHDTIPEHEVRTLFALSNGVLDAALASVMELRRPEAEQSAMWLQRWQENILAGVRMMADRYADLGARTLIPHLSFVVTLDYLMFRLPHIRWHSNHPALSEWTENMLQAEFYQKTDPRLAA